MHGHSTSRSSQLTILLVAVLATAVSACATVKNAADGAARRATGREVAERVDRTIGAAADGAEDAVMGGNESRPAKGGAEAANDATSRNPTAMPAQEVNYDFVPGDRVLFAEDFSGDVVGDFPRSLKFHRGSLEVVELNGVRFVRATSTNSALSIPLPQTLPERFTIELDIYNPKGPYGLILSTGTLPAGRQLRGEPHLLWASPARGGSGLMGPDGKGIAVSRAEIDAVRGFEQAPVRARVMVDDEHMKIYWGDRRIANVPQVDLPRSNAVHLVLEADPVQPIYIGNIRIASGGRDLYAVLENEGRFTARGIHFDTGSERIRPESKPELDEIGLMLQQHSDLELVIEGHTDSEGSEANNKSLSERRAASVRTYLIENYGVGAQRLESAGYGETRPVDSNETAEGRQQNRRVEIVRAGASGGAATRSGPSADSPRMASQRPDAQQTPAERAGELSVTLDGETSTLALLIDRAEGSGATAWLPADPNSDEENIAAFRLVAGARLASEGHRVVLYFPFDTKSLELTSGQRQLIDSRFRAPASTAVGNPPQIEILEYEPRGREARVKGTFRVTMADGRVLSGTFEGVAPAECRGGRDQCG